MYFQIKYTYKNYNEKIGMPKHEYELYKYFLFKCFKRFISINYSPINGVPIEKEVKMI